MQSFPHLRLFSLLFMAGGALLFPACDTADGRRSGAARSVKVGKQPRRGAPAPYYGSNAAGNYYPAPGEGRNANYQPGVKRFDPARRVSATPPAEERSTWRRPVALRGTEYSY